MSISWTAVVGSAININVATLGAVGTGDFTIVVLTKPAGNHGHIGMSVTTGFPIEQLNDSNIWFGGGDFSGFGTSNNSDWHVIGHSKTSGTNVYRWHYWNYSAGGSKTHSNGSGTHANPGTITAIQIGNCDNRGNGLIAVVAVWKRVLSDGEFDSLCTTNLSDWNALAPDALWPLNVAPASVVDVTGHGNDATSVSGTVTGGAADPPSFNYALATLVADPVNGGAGTAGTSDGLTLGDAPGGAGTGGTSDGRSLGDGVGGAGSGGQLDGLALGGASGSAGAGGTTDGRALGDAVGGAGTGGTSDGLGLGDASGGAGAGGQLDGRALGDSSGGAGTGGSPDSLAAGPVVIQDSSGGVGTGGQADTVVVGSQVVHDQMVMPLAIKARDCLVAEVAKLANPPIKVQIRPGSSFTALFDSTRDECCSGVAYVRTGVRVPTTGNWPQPLTGVSGPSASRGRAPFFAVNLELGIYRCLPTISNVPGANDDFPTDAQWLQAAQDQADDGAALLRAVCCLQDIYGNDSVIAGPLTPLDNNANCGGIIVNVQVRAPACDCVD